jgi:hypothetical protein
MHERYLWHAMAGSYMFAKNPDALLAERIEELISRENATWIEEQTEKAR